MDSRISVAKTRRGKRVLESRAPKLSENSKRALLLRGTKTSESVAQLLRDLHAMKKPNVIILDRKNEFHPFEDVTPIEKFSQKYDASLFAMGNHSKKRPNNLIIGRTYDHQLLDMAEFGVANFRPASSFPGPKMTEGGKPLVVFAGEALQRGGRLERVKSLLLDWFRGEAAEQVALCGVECVVAVTAADDGAIRLRTYRVCLKKSGSRTPRVELEPMGPHCDLLPRRDQLASSDLFRTALRKPAAARRRATKNISKDVFGSQLARIHMGRQDLKQLQTRKMKALKRVRGGSDRANPIE